MGSDWARKCSLSNRLHEKFWMPYKRVWIISYGAGFPKFLCAMNFFGSLVKPMDPFSEWDF